MGENLRVDPTESLLLAESADVHPGRARRLAVIDLPGLREVAGEYADEVVCWDDVTADPTPRAAGDPFGELADAVRGADLVWMALPKSLGGLDEYAGLVAQHADDSVLVLATGREKFLNRTMNEVLAAHFGSVRASLGRQKSRVLHASSPLGSPTLSRGWPRSQHNDALSLELWAHGNTFAGTKPDPGTRLLLDQLPSLARDLPDGARVLDLGCGNGTITATLGRLRPDLDLLASDNSRAAVAATTRTVEANGVTAQVLMADGLSGWPDADLDLVVTNPPFHVGHAKNSSATLAFFDELPRVLRPGVQGKSAHDKGGQVWCVFNSHLPWRYRLNQVIGPTEVVAQNPKFMVTRSRLRLR